MRTRIILVFIYLLAVQVVNAQNDTLNTEKSFWDNVFVNVQLGIASEESEEGSNIFRPTTSLVIGYRLSQYFQPGVGIGYDEHKFFQSMPITLWIQGELKDNDFTPFYYALGGRATYWRDDSQLFTDVHGGEYFEVGLGYSWKFEKTKLKFSGGWRKQVFTSIENQPVYWWGWEAFDSFAPYPYNGQKTTWDLEKVVVKLTLEF